MWFDPAAGSSDAFGNPLGPLIQRAHLLEHSIEFRKWVANYTSRCSKVRLNTRQPAPSPTILPLCVQDKLAAAIVSPAPSPVFSCWSHDHNHVGIQAARNNTPKQITATSASPVVFHQNRMVTTATNVVERFHQWTGSVRVGKSNFTFSQQMSEPKFKT